MYHLMINKPSHPPFKLNLCRKSDSHTLKRSGFVRHDPPLITKRNTHDQGLHGNNIFLFPRPEFPSRWVTMGVTPFAQSKHNGRSDQQWKAMHLMHAAVCCRRQMPDRVSHGPSTLRFTSESPHLLLPLATTFTKKSHPRPRKRSH